MPKTCCFSDEDLGCFRNDKFVADVEKVAGQSVGLFDGVNGDPVFDREAVQCIARFDRICGGGRGRWDGRFGRGNCRNGQC